MPLVATQSDPGPRVFLDDARCDRCGRCVEVCAEDLLRRGENQIEIVASRLAGCSGCAQCMAICPHDAIHVVGRGLAEDDLFVLPDQGGRATSPQLIALMQARRSCRRFRADPVPLGDVHLILDAARAAPTARPEHGVGVLILHGATEVRAFQSALREILCRRRWLLRAPVAWLWRAWWDRARRLPLRSWAEATRRPGGEGGDPADAFLCGAPLALLFHSSTRAEPGDAVMAAAHAMLAAEALDYGTNLLSVPGRLLAWDAALMRRYGLSRHDRPGLALMVGRPALRPNRGIRRHFARETWVFNQANPD